MSKKLESLIVDLQVNSAALKAGLDKANNQIKTFADKADKAGRMISAALAFKVAKDATVALANFVMGGAKAADQMGKLAQSAGVPVEALSRLNYAASFSGVSTEQLGGSLSKLQKHMAEAATGGVAQAAVFRALGVSVKGSNGELRGVDVVMGDLAEKFSSMSDGTSKSALAMELFGKTGAELIPLLNVGRDGLAAFAKESDLFGNTITADAAASAEVFNDTLETFGKIADGVALRVAAELAPSVANLGKELLGAKGNAEALNVAVQILAGTMRTLVSAGVVVAGIWEALGTTLGAVSAAALFAVEGDFRSASEAMNDLKGNLTDTTQATVDRISAIWSKDDAALKSMDKQKKAAKLNADEVLKSTKAVKQEITQLAFVGEVFLKRGGSFSGSTTNAAANTAAGINANRPGGLGGGTSAANRIGTFPMTKSSRSVKGQEMLERMHVAGPARSDPAAMIAAQDRLANAASSAASALGKEFEPRLGKIGQMIDAATGELATSISDMVASAGGGAAAGGIIGAVVGIITSLIGDSAGFMGVIEVAGAVIQTLADLLAGPFLVPVQRLIAALMPLAIGLGNFLAPVGKLFEFVTNILIPPIYMLGLLFQSLGPIMNILAFAVAGTLSIIVGSLMPVFQLLFEAFRWMGIGILEATKLLAPAWNGMLKGIADFMRSIASFSFKIGEVTIAPFTALGDLANTLDSTQISTTGLDEQLKELRDITWQTTQAKAEETRQTILQTDAVKKSLGAWLNVPEGYRVAQARFDAMDPEAGGTDQFGPIVGTPSATGGVMHVTIQSENPRVLWSQLKQLAERENVLAFGTEEGA